MKVKLQACISNEDGIFEPPQIVDVRESIAFDWIKNKWAIDPEGEVILAADGTLKIERKVKYARAAIETPEASLAVAETADVKISRRQRRPT